MGFLMMETDAMVTFANTHQVLTADDWPKHASAMQSQLLPIKTW